MTEPTDATPAPGSRWTHRNGAPYTVLMIANADTQDGARYPVTVVYQGDNGKVWSRPASDWHRSMTATTPQPTQAQAGAVPLTQYRVLEPGVDCIEADDEYLQDDAQTWAIDPNGTFVGTLYGYALRAARRRIAKKEGADHA